MVGGVVPGAGQRVAGSCGDGAKVNRFGGVLPQRNHPVTVRRGGPSGGHAVAVVVGIEIKADDPLMKVGDAAYTAGAVFGAGESREQQRGKNGDNRDDNEKFYQGKPEDEARIGTFPIRTGKPVR